jgi:hypothetical protein
MSKKLTSNHQPAPRGLHPVENAQLYYREIGQRMASNLKGESKELGNLTESMTTLLSWHCFSIHQL